MSKKKEEKKNEKVVVEVKETRVPAFWTGLLTIIMIIAYVFTPKYYEPVKNILISGGIVIYPISFLIIAIISKYYGFASARKSIITSSILYLISMLLIMVSVFPRANLSTAGYNSVVQYIFTNNFVELSPGGLSLFYPTWGQFLGVVVAFVISHLVYATIYNALKEFTIDYLAVGLGLFIAYIIDRLIFIPMLLAQGLMKGNNSFDFLIQNLTSEFIFSILMVIIIIIVYVIVTAIKKDKNV